MIAHAESFQHLRHGYVDLAWSTARETELTPTSAEIRRAAGTGVRLLQGETFVQQETTRTLMRSFGQQLGDHCEIQFQSGGVPHWLCGRGQRHR